MARRLSPFDTTVSRLNMQSHIALIRRTGALCALAVSVCAWGDTLKDPTRPPATVSEASATVSAPVVATSSFKLEGIVRQGARLVAIIDGQVVRPGSWVGDARIDAVTIDAVSYTRAGQSRTVRFETTPVRVRRTATIAEDRS